MINYTFNLNTVHVKTCTMCSNFLAYSRQTYQYSAFQSISNEPALQHTWCHKYKVKLSVRLLCEFPKRTVIPSGVKLWQMFQINNIVFCFFTGMIPSFTKKNVTYRKYISIYLSGTWRKIYDKSIINLFMSVYLIFINFILSWQYYN